MRSRHREHECEQRERQPGQQPPEVVAGGGEDGVDRVALLACEVIAAHPMLAFGVADDRLDGRAAAQLAFDLVGDAPLLTRDIDLEAIVWRRVVAAVSPIGDDAGETDADLRLDFGDDRLQRVAVIRIARQRLGVGDELAALGMMERRGDAEP